MLLYTIKFIFLVLEYCELGDFSKFLNNKLKEKHAPTISTTNM